MAEFVANLPKAEDADAVHLLGEGDDVHEESDLARPVLGAHDLKTRAEVVRAGKSDQRRGSNPGQSVPGIRRLQDDPLEGAAVDVAHPQLRTAP